MPTSQSIILKLLFSSKYLTQILLLQLHFVFDIDPVVLVFAWRSSLVPQHSPPGPIYEILRPLAVYLPPNLISPGPTIAKFGAVNCIAVSSSIFRVCWTLQTRNWTGQQHQSQTISSENTHKIVRREQRAADVWATQGNSLRSAASETHDVFLGPPGLISQVGHSWCQCVPSDVLS